MFDAIFKKVLSSLMSQGGAADDGKFQRLEKELARKVNAIEVRAEAENRNRWLFLVGVCVVVLLVGFFAFKKFKSDVNATVSARLDKEFSSTQLQATIEESAKKYAEQTLKTYVDTQIAAHYKVAKLESLARLDSRKAYEELAALSADPQFKDDAVFSLSVVQKKYEPLVYPFEAAGTLEKGEGATIQLKLEPLKSAEPQIDALRPRLRQLALDSQKNYLVPDFIRFLKESDSLGASVGICRILRHNYGDKAGDYEFGRWIEFLQDLDKAAVKIQ